MKLNISDKDKFLASRNIPVQTKVLKKSENWIFDREGKRLEAYEQKWTSTIDDKYKGKLITFIDECFEFGVSLTDIAALLGQSKQYIHKLWKYGWPPFDHSEAESEARKAKKRDGGKCRICKSPKNLHTHHVASSRIHEASNFIMLCVSCHMKVEALKRRFVKSGKKVSDFSYAQHLVDERKQDV